MPKRPFAIDYSGVVSQSRNRQTGTVISVVDNRDGLHDEDCGWLAVCEDHGSILWTDTRTLATAHAAYPEWCEDCAEIIYNRKGK